jgi:tetratricopeptide (TPR) repeat protein
MRAVRKLLVPATRALAFAVAMLLGSQAHAQQEERPYSLGESTSTELSKVQPLLEANNPTAALAIVDAQIGKVEANSYDLAVLLQVKAQLLLQANRLKEGIEPLERCLALSDAHNPPFFEQRVTQEFVYFLAQLYFQEATSTKDDKLASTYFDKAEAGMARWTDAATNPAAEPLMFYASLLFNRATQEGSSTDFARVDKALSLVDRALLLEARPKENLYVLKLACMLQKEKYAEAAEIIELLLQRKPENSSYWQQLVAIYLSLGQEVRAVLSMERAQSHGFMNTPKDNYNLVGVYFNMGHYGKAAELLEAGLKRGTLDNDLKNWELLSYSYQQLGREFKSIDALNRAITANPTAGQLDYAVAQAYFGLNRNADAMRHAKEAVRKGNLNRPDQAYLFLAYLSFEAGEFQVALEATDKAIAYPESKEEGNRMKSAILDAISEREAKLQKM